MTDPYSTLGVARTASQDDIRKAFKKLARKYHPDVNKDPGAEDRFKEINNAYGAIGDTEKRKLWDEFGEASQKPGFDAERARQFRNFGGGGGFPGGGFGGGRGGGVHVDFGGDMGDIFSSLFGGGGGMPRGPRRGQDQRASLTIDFLTSVLGGEREIQIQRPTGARDSLKVRIPPGVQDGGKLRLKGQGLPPPGGGPCGDLELQLTVTPHAHLRRRDKDDLEMDLPITILEAMEGASVTVPTPTGDVKVTVPANARPGQLLRLKGRGVQKRIPGHLYLVLRPTPPETTDPEVLAAARRLEEAYTTDVRAGLAL
ncbi:MAG: DnaJ domain-containing protein [Myxococcales bacterium]|nr:DnaJ domain-containing protein [Myxococcales bacterium]MCB9694916.1 DnaJ domain-containing protein [Alphaproteobacteria bacterium]